MPHELIHLGTGLGISLAVSIWYKYYSKPKVKKEWKEKIKWFIGGFVFANSLIDLDHIIGYFNLYGELPKTIDAMRTMPPGSRPFHNFYLPSVFIVSWFFLKNTKYDKFGALFLGALAGVLLHLFMDILW